MLVITALKRFRNDTLGVLPRWPYFKNKNKGSTCWFRSKKILKIMVKSFLYFQDVREITFWSGVEICDGRQVVKGGGARGHLTGMQNYKHS